MKQSFYAYLQRRQALPLAKVVALVPEPASEGVCAIRKGEIIQVTKIKSEKNDDAKGNRLDFEYVVA